MDQLSPSFPLLAVLGGGQRNIAVAFALPDHHQLWQQTPWPVWVVGLPCGALVTNVLIIDDIRDRHFDRVKGWRTVAVRFGLVGSRCCFRCCCREACCCNDFWAKIVAY